MTKNLIRIALLLLFFTAANVRAQNDSTWQLVDGHGNFSEQLIGMKWPSVDTGYFFGSTLDLFSTSDSGLTLNQLPALPHPITQFMYDSSGVMVSEKTSYLAIQAVSDVSWPTGTNGIVLGLTNSDNYGHAARPIVLITSNAGSSWTASYPSDTADQYTNISFPTPSVGYASVSDINDAKYFLTKTIDGGKTWAQVYSADTLGFSKLYFRDANNGMAIATGQGAFPTAHLVYTTNGGTSFTVTSLPTDSALTFAKWNDDSSWLAGADNIYRSTDSGKNWTSVVSDDPVNGPASVAAFSGDSGFAVRSNAFIVNFTTDYGKTWTSSHPSTVDLITPISAAMLSPYRGYMLGSDVTATGTVLFKIDFAMPDTSTNTGGDGVVETANTFAIPFAVTAGQNAITFTMQPMAGARSIEVLDLLGRSVISVPVGSGMSNAKLPDAELRSGTYFARLGTAVAKFAVQ
ncbi:MAG TPA: sialidase family protein [Candidatus Kapabacteria bacterium]|jgi:photosystem II stability/assembly factor-like uncharacterized protein